MLTLFLGSGASPLFHCQVAEITEAMVKAKMKLNSRQIFIPCEPSTTVHSPIGEAVPQLLSRIRRDLAKIKGVKPDVITYEQIGAICIELEGHRSDPRSPSVDAYWRKLARELGPRAKSDRRDSIEEAFDELICLAVGWVRSVVRDELKKPANQPPDLGATPLVKLLKTTVSNAPAWSIVTLNHDCLIEQALRHLGVGFRDGFCLRNDLLEFDPSILRSETSRQLLKLHGSIDWRRHRDRNTYIKPFFDDDGTDALQARPEAEILFGDYTKMEDYNYGIFPYLFSSFDRVLAATRKLLVCGYGFQDAGVNLRLFSELRYRPDVSVLLIHPEPRTLIDRAPFHAWQQLKELLCNGRIRLLRGRLQEVLAGEHYDRLQAFVRGR